MLKVFLEKIGLSDQEISLYMALSELGVQPASAIARFTGMDRINAYKHLKKLAAQGYLVVYVKSGAQFFGVAPAESLASAIQKKKMECDALLKEIPAVEKHLSVLGHGQQTVPRLEVFEGPAGIRRLLKDVLFEARSQGIPQVRMLTSNTFEQKLGQATLEEFIGEFFADAKERGVSVDIIEASGTLLLERLRHIPFAKFDPKLFPASRGAANVFLIGSAFYVASYQDVPIGLKVKQEAMSQVFHFFFDVLGKNVE
ncbi:MAG: helix-turn-helix domain-containing protein [Candidatus Peribacteraceae bacterium]|nr:helix-turn-helix domain-containing protein [Candidatus Peribacteraceae bacterium]